jgi:hypothetical protein
MIPCPPLELPADRPVLLLDFDGVINVFQCLTAREAQTPTYLKALKLLPGFESWLAQLHQVFYLVWCSDAGPLVNIELAAAWGIGPRPCVQPMPEEGPLRQWKAHAARRLFADWPGALAWVQDGFLAEERAWAAERLAAGRPTWLIDVTETGLTAEVTADLLRWAGEELRIEN